MCNCNSILQKFKIIADTIKTQARKKIRKPRNLFEEVTCVLVLFKGEVTVLYFYIYFFLDGGGGGVEA